MYYNKTNLNEIKKEYTKIDFFNKRKKNFDAIQKVITTKPSELQILGIRLNIIIVLNNLNDLIRNKLFDVKIDISNLEKIKNIYEYDIQINDITDELINELNNINNILNNTQTINKINCTSIEKEMLEKFVKVRAIATLIQSPMNEKKIINCNSEDLKKQQELYKIDLKNINEYIIKLNKNL